MRLKIGIIGAMAQEVEILRNLMVEAKVIEIAGCKIYDGKINNTQVALLQSGIGKVAAAVGTALLLELTKPDMIINTGSGRRLGCEFKCRRYSDFYGSTPPRCGCNGVRL